MQGDTAEGEWHITHDRPTLTADEGKKIEFLLLDAPAIPEGTDLLCLLPKPHWNFETSSALTSGKLSAPK